MKTLPTLIILLSLGLGLTGCATDAYYGAIRAKYENPPDAPQPLVDHSWTDAAGGSHSLTVHQPVCGQSRNEDRIPAPWDGAYKFFDRSLGTAERFFPWLMFLGGDRGSRASSSVGGDGTSITTGDGATVTIDSSSSSTTMAPTEGE